METLNNPAKYEVPINNILAFNPEHKWSNNKMSVLVLIKTRWKILDSNTNVISDTG